MEGAFFLLRPPREQSPSSEARARVSADYDDRDLCAGVGRCAQESGGGGLTVSSPNRETEAWCRLPAKSDFFFFDICD